MIITFEGVSNAVRAWFSIKKVVDFFKRPSRKELEEKLARCEVHRRFYWRVLGNFTGVGLGYRGLENFIKKYPERIVSADELEPAQKLALKVDLEN